MPTPPDDRPRPAPARSDGALPDPLDIGEVDFGAYALMIDARSPHEYAHDHLPGAVNLPVVDDAEYAEVGTLHKDDTHAAYLIGVDYSLRNISRHIRESIVPYGKDARMLVYCFRGGKRSKLWADALRTIGYEVDVLRGGWKNYRRWVLAELESLPRRLDLRVLSGATATGKTRLLLALRAAGEQVIDLEALASHRGSIIGDLPGQPQPTQKYFDTLLLEQMRGLDLARPVWVEAESKRIGRIQLPDALFESMHLTVPIHLTAPMPERVRLWREDYAHFAADPVAMVDKLAGLKPLIGGTELDHWHALARAGDVDALFERVMVAHYDPAYDRSTRKAYGQAAQSPVIALESLAEGPLRAQAEVLAAQFGNRRID